MVVSTKPATAKARVNEQGDLVIPGEAVTRHGHNPGALVQLNDGTSFALCTFCDDCELDEGNQENCFANFAPVCGECL